MKMFYCRHHWWDPEEYSEVEAENSEKAALLFAETHDEHEGTISDHEVVVENEDGEKETFSIWGSTIPPYAAERKRINP